jgi:RNA 3'-terminal phosphate cyclase
MTGIGKQRQAARAHSSVYLENRKRESRAQRYAKNPSRGAGVIVMMVTHALPSLYDKWGVRTMALGANLERQVWA